MFHNLFQKKKTIYLGHSLAQCSRVRSVLEHAGIPFRVKIQNHSGEWIGTGTVRGHTGFGGRDDSERLYEILIEEKDYEQAVFLLR